MLCFIGVLLLWFLVRLYCRIANVDQTSQPYELDKIYLDPITPDGGANKGYAIIQPEENWSISEDEVRRVLKASKELSKSTSN
jgi:hypothetical protein